MYDDVRAWVRINVPGSLIVYLDVPHDVRLSRDAGTKNVYGSGADPEASYDEPLDADLRLKDDEEVSPVDVAAIIVERFLARNLISRIEASPSTGTRTTRIRTASEPHRHLRWRSRNDCRGTLTYWRLVPVTAAIQFF